MTKRTHRCARCGRLLVLAVPAMAFNGYRGDYTTSDYCSICHQVGQPGSAPKVYDQLGRDQARRCGCGRPGAEASLRLQLSAAATRRTSTRPRWSRRRRRPPAPTATSGSSRRRQRRSTDRGRGPTVGSGCGTHRRRTSSAAPRATTARPPATAPQYGNDPNDTAHMAPKANLANADDLRPVPFALLLHGATPTTYSRYRTPSVDAAAGTPIRRTRARPRSCSRSTQSASRCSERRRRWTPARSSNVLNVQSPDVTPTPDPSATTAAGLMKYWQVDGVDTLWQSSTATTAVPTSTSTGQAAPTSRPRSPTSRPSWARTRRPLPRVPLGRLPHRAGGAASPPALRPSTASPASAATPRTRRARPGHLGQGIHASAAHRQPEDAVRRVPQREIPEGTTASPGTEIHHPMKEMIDGYGAIDVSAFPSVHKGKCVQCHMPPTTSAAATSSWVATTRSTSSSRRSPRRSRRSRSVTTTPVAEDAVLPGRPRR